VLRTLFNCLLFCSSVISVAVQLAAAQEDRVSGPIGDSRLVTLEGGANPRVRPENDRGAVDDDTRVDYMTLVFQPSPKQRRTLRDLLRALQDPLSPTYHKWLTPEQFGESFGASPGNLANVSAWLQSEGFTIESTARGRDWIVFSGTAGQVAKTFHAAIHHFEVNGKMHFANDTPPSIPAALREIVAAIRGLDDFYPEPLALARPFYNVLARIYTLAPADFGTIYDVTPLWNSGIDGTGQSIVIAGQATVDMNDIVIFREAFGLPNRTPQQILVGPPPAGSLEDTREADLDLEWSGATAPNAKLINVYARNAIDAVAYAVDNNLAPVISYSFGQCELALSDNSASALQLLAQQANAQGITWVAASGDGGAATCDYQQNLATHGLTVSFPASMPEVTGVGGTVLNYSSNPTEYLAQSGTALSYIPEAAWNDTLISLYEGLYPLSGGGGASTLYPQPYWQTEAGVPNNNARNLPDVAFAASPYVAPYLTISQKVQMPAGGTSASTPAFAGVLALLNHYLVTNGTLQQPGLGNINPMLYGLAGNVPQAFHDIVTGNNFVPCQPGSPNCGDNGLLGYQAGPGYDQVTGLGSIDVWQMVQNWNPRFAIAPPAGPD
jgi:subtilase family serine protease